MNTEKVLRIYSILKSDESLLLSEHNRMSLANDDTLSYVYENTEENINNCFHSPWEALCASAFSDGYYSVNDKYFRLDKDKCLHSFSNLESFVNISKIIDYIIDYGSEELTKKYYTIIESAFLDYYFSMKIDKYDGNKLIQYLNDKEYDLIGDDWDVIINSFINNS